MQKDALDRRLSLQPPQVAHASSCSPAPQKQNQRGRKIAPTRIQSAAEPVLRNQLPFGTVSTQVPDEEPAGLAVEASAGDLFCPEQAPGTVFLKCRMLLRTDKQRAAVGSTNPIWLGSGRASQTCMLPHIWPSLHHIMIAMAVTACVA